MNNKLLLFSSSAIATGLLLGANSTTQANASTTNDMSMNHDMQSNMNQKQMGMNHDMQNNMNQKQMGMHHMTQETMMPYYNYNGYTTYDGHFTQDNDFVRALKYDNVMIDGYKVNTAATDKTVTSSKKFIVRW
ncbi:immunodominant staphylococcal antigen IsaB family protein [Staphylococcus arlettae]|uniref:immunodominant staphylococcal antigen IsaB family protein n=1 Tax=Staphylococcus arlettae TaxID=29378 RepID=UPI001E32398D|nr:hypothetical protein [Staphylococcus arlettae]